MDDIAAIGTIENIWKGILNCRRMEIEKKMINRLKKTKYMVTNTGKKNYKRGNRRKSQRRNSSRNRDIYKYLKMVINRFGNLKDHVLELDRKCEVCNREISANGAKRQIEKEEIRVKLQL